MELRVGNKYRLGRKIGSGSFGDIYLGTTINTGEEVSVWLRVPPTGSAIVMASLLCWTDNVPWRGGGFGFVVCLVVSQTASARRTTSADAPPSLPAIACACRSGIAASTHFVCATRRDLQCASACIRMCVCVHISPARRVGAHMYTGARLRPSVCASARTRAQIRPFNSHRDSNNERTNEHTVPRPFPRSHQIQSERAKAAHAPRVTFARARFSFR